MGQFIGNSCLQTSYDILASKFRSYPMEWASVSLSEKQSKALGEDPELNNMNMKEKQRSWKAWSGEFALVAKQQFEMCWSWAFPL